MEEDQSGIWKGIDWKVSKILRRGASKLNGTSLEIF
jgi:hypothetical protein